MVIVILVLVSILIILVGFLIRSIVALNNNVLEMHDTFKTFKKTYEVAQEADTKLRRMNFEVINKISQGF